MKGALPFAALLALLAASPSAALEVGGYAKNLYDYTRTQIDHAPYWLDLTRTRLSLEQKASLPSASEDGPRLVAHVDYDQEVRTGSYFNSTDYRFLGFPETPTYWGLDQTISTGNAYAWRHRLYRGWAAVETEDWTARVGRQRVAWGTGKLWNPTDVLNPFDPTSIERDERRGVDALYARRGLGTLGQAEGAWAFGDRWASTDLLGRVHGNRGTVDASLMGGKVAGSTASWMAGGDFAANVAEGNLHGEWSYTDLRTRTPFWRAMLGYEYTLPADLGIPQLRDLYILGEYFHNGAGQTDPRRYQPAILLSGRDVALGQDYLGLSLQRELHPLLNGEVHQILNLRDHSHFLNADLAWNAVKDFYLTAGLQRFAGGAISEYGRLPNIAYLQGQYFF